MLKHIILITDGYSRGGNFMKLAETMAEHNITLSTVGIGQKIDQGFMKMLADDGGGEFYYVNDPYSLPRILTKDTVTKMRNYIVEEEFQAIVTSSNSPGVRGIDWSSAPANSAIGRNRTSLARPPARSAGRDSCLDGQRIRTHTQD